MITSSRRDVAGASDAHIGDKGHDGAPCAYALLEARDHALVRVGDLVSHEPLQRELHHPAEDGHRWAGHAEPEDATLRVRHLFPS